MSLFLLSTWSIFWACYFVSTCIHLWVWVIVHQFTHSFVFVSYNNNRVLKLIFPIGLCRCCPVWTNPQREATNQKASTSLHLCSSERVHHHLGSVVVGSRTCPLNRVTKISSPSSKLDISISSTQCPIVWPLRWFNIDRPLFEKWWDEVNVRPTQTNPSLTTTLRFLLLS